MMLLDTGHILMRGFVPAASAILSLGPQNVFVLRRGLSRRHITVTIAICFGSDMALMSLAVLGFAATLDGLPFAPLALRLAGCLYLTLGAIRMFASACRGGGGHVAGTAITCLRQTVFGAAVVSLLNPLAWIESVFVVGGLAATLPGETLIMFALGAFAGSLLKFSLLGFGARRVSFLFSRPSFCRAFDATAAVALAGMVAMLL